MFDDLDSRRITVMGLGRFGGGAGVTRWLVAQGAKVLVTDRQSEAEIGPSLESIQDLVERGDVELRLGEHREDDFRECDLVVANPAVSKPWENKFLTIAQQVGIPITTEIRLLIERLDRNHIIGVTGTAGKSTVSSMIHHLLTQSGLKAHLGGNLGGSLLGSLEMIGEDDWIVLELSSAMLHWLGKGVGYEGAKGFSPHVGVLTNLVPNHLDWHGSFEHYEQSKRNIFRYQQDGDHRITADLFHQRRKLPLKLPGKHNQLNGQFAMAAVLRATDILPQDAAPLLASFEGLPHRLQLIAEHEGIAFYNDSKSTTPKATVLAVESFKKPSKIHLIAGGYDKGVDLSPIAALSTRIGGLYTIGATGSTLAAQAGSPAVYSETLDQAFAAALERMTSGGEGILLLSPGCASWDQFDNFEQRGDRFAALTQQLGRPTFSHSQECGNVNPAPHP